MKRPFLARKKTMSDTATVKNHAAFIWSVADLLRGDYKPADYGTVILPFTVVRRLDCVLAPTKAEVLAALALGKAEGAALARGRAASS